MKRNWKSSPVLNEQEQCPPPPTVIQPTSKRRRVPISLHEEKETDNCSDSGKVNDDIYRSDCLRTRLLAIRSSLSSSLGVTLMQEDIARIRSDFEATTSFSRNSFAQFGPLKRLESTCGNDFDEDLLRLPELRRGTASGELWSQPRKILGGMTPMGERRYQYEEARICQRSLDLQRVGVSRYGQFFWDLDDHFQRQREARRLRLLGLQPRPFVEDAPGILDHGRMISTGDSFVAEARRINHHCNASKLKVQAGPTVSSSIPSSRLLTSSGLIRSSPTLADAETHCPLQSKVFTDAALLAAGRAVAEVAPERFSSSSDTRRRTLPHSDDDAEMSSVCGRASLLESSKGRENAAKGCNLSPQQQESTCLAKEKRTSRKAYPGDVDNLASTYPKGTEHLLSNEPSTDDLTVNNPIARLVKQYSAGGTKEAPFPLKLHAILANPEYHDIIGWLPHGNAWKIFQVSLFEQILVPRHFRHAKYASFMRQVNGWGFQRRSHPCSMENNSYFHDLFVREDPQKCLKMIRTGGAKNAAGERVFMNNEESVTPKKRKCKETGRYAQAGKQFGVDRIVLDENDHKDWIGSGSAINMEYHAKEEEKRSSPCYRPSKRKRREPVVEVSNRQQNHIDEPCTNDRSKARAKKRYVVEIQDLLTTQGDNSEDEGKQKESTQYLSSSSSSQDEIVPTSAKARNKKLIDD